MSRHKIFFLHNPKAGGSSLRALFLSLMENKTIAPVFANSPNDHPNLMADLDDKLGFDCYFGHYGFDVYQALHAGHILMTNFRDPVQRIYSMYRYWRNNVSKAALAGLPPADAAVVSLSQDLSFSEFIREKSADLLLYISNFHFRQLHSSGWKTRDIGFWDVRTVRKRVRQMPWFYIAEMPETSRFLLRNLYTNMDNLNIPKENISFGDIDDISIEDIKYLIDINSFDYMIYAYAVKIHAERLCHSRPR